MKRPLINLILLTLLLVTQTIGLETYTIYNNVNSTTVRLIDLNGNLVKSWSCTRPISWNMPYLILPDSIIIRSQSVPNPQLPAAAYGGHIQKIAWNGTVLWNFIYSDYNHIQHHDIQPMPNGNILLQAVERKTRAQAESLGRINISGEMWPDMIVEVDPRTDSIVWEWHIWDHLIQDVDPSKPNYGVVREHPELLDINCGQVGPYGGDWIHANFIDYNEELDQIIFSSHNLSEIFIIDHSTTTEQARGHRGGNSNMGGDILYRWGNPQNYDRGTSADQHLFVVHGVNWIDPGLPGEGHILMFNNGDRPGTSGDSSSVEEIIPPRTGYTYYIHPDSAFGPKQPCWVYSNGASFYSGRISGAFRLSNGNTFICEGLKGHLFEVTPSGQVIWNFNTGGQVANAKRYDFGSAAVKDYSSSNLRKSLLLEASPNPFKKSTTLRLNLPVKGRVLLIVYDLAGRVVEILVDEEKEAGSYEINFTPEQSNLTGSISPVGICFVRLMLQTHSGKDYEIFQKIIKIVKLKKK